MSTPLTHEEALIYVMVTMAAVDNNMGDKELLRIGDMVKILPVFEKYDANDVVTTSRKCGELLQQEDSLPKMLNLIAETLPLSLYETAYALAVEIAAADMSVEPEELRFLQMLRDKLDLEKLIIASIEYAARVRHRKA